MAKKKQVETVDKPSGKEAVSPDEGAMPSKRGSSNIISWKPKKTKTARKTN